MNATINVLLSEQLISDKKRKQPKEMKRFQNKLKSCANMVKYWATGDGRPENSSYVGFDTTPFKSGKVTIPKYY